MPLGSILAVWDGCGCHFGGLGDILGMGWVPDWPGDRTMCWPSITHCRLCGAMRQISIDTSGGSYISEGLRPLPPAPNLEDSMIRRFDASMDC